MAEASARPPITVEPPPGGFDRAGARQLLSAAELPRSLHRVLKAPFGHTVESLRALEHWVEAVDLARQAGEGMHAALLEDLAETGSLAIPEPTTDQRIFIGAFTLTVLTDHLAAELAAMAPPPAIESDLESDGLDELLTRPADELITRVLGMARAYIDLRAKQQPEASSPKLEVRTGWSITTQTAFVLQLRGAVQRLTKLGRLRPFGLALRKRKVRVGERRYEGFESRSLAEPASDLKPVRIDQIVGNREYIDAGMKLARDVAAFDLERGKSPKQINPVLFGLGRPGCGKTITAHAIGNYFLEYCRERDIPAKFKVIRRTDWASSYQNASAAQLIKIFKEEVYGFEGVCGVYWADIDTAFASRGSGGLRIEEKNNLGAVFGIFDGTLIPKDGKWFMMCDANYMQMDEATKSRIAQNPFTVSGPTEPEEYVTLMRDIMLKDVAEFVHAEDPRWQEVGKACVECDLSGRNVEAVSNNIRAHVQDFEYPEEYFKADFDRRAEIIFEKSQRVTIDDVLGRVRHYAEFQRDADDKAEKERFDSDVESMVRQLNAGREAAERAAAAMQASAQAQAAAEAAATDAS
jgi:hypothetical protein